MQNLFSKERAMDLDMEDNTICNDVWILYKPKSDFISLYTLMIYIINLDP